jgi:hypothetical protein
MFVKLGLTYVKTIILLRTADTDYLYFVPYRSVNILYKTATEIKKK